MYAINRLLSDSSLRLPLGLFNLVLHLQAASAWVKAGTVLVAHRPDMNILVKLVRGWLATENALGVLLDQDLNRLHNTSSVLSVVVKAHHFPPVTFWVVVPAAAITDVMVKMLVV
jgi:hypothetical protein